jgi:hypothetical protein
MVSPSESDNEASCPLEIMRHTSGYMKLNEAIIRDHLAANLSLIEAGLTLVDKEFYLKNDHGAAGFLDIFARTEAGQLVVIEIKRTNSAAREAIQELYKYAALLRGRFLIQEIELRLILLSVQWHELLLPYSEFAQTTPYELSAGKIILDLQGLPIAINRVDPIPTATGRRIGVRHFLWRFPNKDGARRALPLLVAFIREAGLSDFVLIESWSSDSRISGNGFLYFAQQELPFNEYMQLIERNLSTDQLDEFRETLQDLQEEQDRVAEASDAAWAYKNGAPYSEIGSDHMEISNPEKAQKWFEEGAQTWTKVHRFGRFEDMRLSDEMIIAEIVGEAGESDFRLRFTARTDSPPRMNALTTKMENIFFYNSDWRGAVRDLMNYAQRTGPAMIELIAFSNEDILRGIAGMAFGFTGYLPEFRLEITRGATIERFIGLVEWDGTAPDLEKIVAKHFMGDPFSYFMAVHFGENRTMNLDIMNDLGLTYKVFRTGDDARPERIRVQGSSIRIESRPMIGSVATMISKHTEQVGKIVELFMEHDQGFQQIIGQFLETDLPSAEREVAAMARELPRPNEVMHWCGEITSCDLCGRSFGPLRYMIDALLPVGGANICAVCFLERGIGLGTGKGQLYEATSEGWHHIAG